jgi:hypothetical protein
MLLWLRFGPDHNGKQEVVVPGHWEIATMIHDKDSRQLSTMTTALTIST